MPLDEPANPQDADAAGEPARDWLDVPRLLGASRTPAGQARLLLLPPLGLLSMFAAVGVLLLAPGGGLWPAMVSLLLLGVSVGVTVTMARFAKLARTERRRVDEAEELLALRRFPQAAALLRGLLGRPMRLPQTRAAALVQLQRLLARYERHDEAADVADALLDGPGLDPATAFAVGCGRAVSLLRTERLSDANGALSALRRDVDRLAGALQRAADDDASAEGILHGEVVGESVSPAFDSAALATLELYRDVHTRHDEEALASFDAKRDVLRDSLGVGFGGPLALAATSAGRLGQGDRAAKLWADATCLVPAAELRRRYPEVAEAADAYPATPHPASAAAAAREAA